MTREHVGDVEPGGSRGTGVAGPDGRLLWVDESSCAILGRPREQLVPRRCRRCPGPRPGRFGWLGDRRRHDLSSSDVSVSASVGVSLAGAATDPAALRAEAGAAMHRAKRLDGPSVVLCDEEMRLAGVGERAER